MKYKTRKRASDPLSAMIYAVLDALNHRVSKFVTKDMNQLVQAIKWLKSKLK